MHFFIHSGIYSSEYFRSSILHLFAGITVKGVIDDLDCVIKILKTTGFGEDRFYIHCDGALSSLMMPFVKRAPKILFEKPIGSVCISGHKFLGCPMPCGVHITGLDHIKALSRNIEYIGFQDATLMGSRIGHAPIFLWYALNQKGHQGLQREVQMCLKNSQYLKERPHASGISVMLNEFSNIVVLESHGMKNSSAIGSCLQFKFDEFLRDLAENRAIWLREGKHQPLCASPNLGKENCACPLRK
ncbi:serine decarboxylase-like [Papaver somniferum]|uniref:serine decarboxylase-like n=1 Tax=Papaver somniferum TaxID=3469 RepID=UPI000E6FBCC3|nr:serine decarboxylase-like [Papaver somniferum]